MATRKHDQHPVKVFTQAELEELKQDPLLCNHDRRTFLKWSTLLASQAIVGGGVLNLLTGEPAMADDTFVNVTSWVKSVCGYCSVGCGLEIGVNSAGKAVAVRGNAVHPTNAGRVCVKGLYEHKILHDQDLRVGSRAKYPMKRDANGNWQNITWDEATTLLAQKIIEAVNTAGPDSVAIYNTGQWTIEEYYSMGKLGKGAIGTSTMDSNTRLCMAAAVYGYMSTFGSDGPPGCYDDIENTDCFFLIGTNPAEMHPQVWRRIIQARRSARAPKMIVVDPRRTATARSADLHLQLKPGTNVALMNGILQQLIANNWIDNAYINAHTRNFSALAAKVAAYTPTYVAGITGLTAADIQTAAQWIGQSPEVWSMFIQGVYQSMGGTDTVRLICAMHLITGKIGRPGSSPFSITGQATAMSNREAGGSSALSGYRNYYNPDPRRRAGTAVERRARHHSAARHHGRHLQPRPAADHSQHGRDDAQRHAQGVLGGLHQPLGHPARPEQVSRLPQLQQPGAPVRGGAGHLRPDGIHALRRPVPAGGAMGREDRHLHLLRAPRQPRPAGGAAGRLRTAPELRRLLRPRDHQDGGRQAGGVRRPLPRPGRQFAGEERRPRNGVQRMEAGVEQARSAT